MTIEYPDDNLINIAPNSTDKFEVVEPMDDEEYRRRTVLALEGIELALETLVTMYSVVE